MYAFMLQAGEGGDSEPFSAYVWGKIAELNGSDAAIDITTLSTVQLEDEEEIIKQNKLSQIAGLTI